MEIDKIYLCNCIDFMSNLPNESIDLIVTDPPYLINYKTNYRKDKTHKFCHAIYNDNSDDLIIKAINECYRVLKNNSAMYMCCGCDKVDFFKKQLENVGFKFKNLIVWVKNSWTAGDLDAQYGKQYEFIFLVNKGRKIINGSRLTDVWSSYTNKSLKRVAGDEQVHQNEKPIELMKICIEKHSNEGDIVLDPFMGSGTTCLAAKELNRHFLGCEIDKQYYEIAKQKINYIHKGQATIFTNFEDM